MTVHDHSTRSSAEPVTQWTPPAGSPPPSGGRKRNPKLAIAGALVAVAIASGGVTAGIMAAVGRGNGNSVTGVPGAGGGLGGGFGGRGGGTGVALHGTSVVSDGNGGYSTELTQTGTVSAVSGSAITVKSEDGYSKSYAITSSTSVDNASDQIGSVVAGHTVRIVADAKANATAITDTNLSGGQNQGGPGNGQPPGQ